MKLKLMGKKSGMTQLFDEMGHLIPCTVIEVMEPNVVTQVKTVETDGYNAIQTGYGKIATKDARTVERRMTKPLRGKFAKAGVEPCKKLVETRVENVEGYEVGQAVGVTAFSKGSFVDATSTSKGKGFQGVMKRYGFGGGRASHGSGFHRSPGSTGGLTPSRSLPNEKRPGQMGNKRTTVQNLEVMEIDEKAGIIVVKGAVPGPTNSIVTLQPAVKKQ